MSDEVQVPNPYLAAIRSKRDMSVGPAETLRTALDVAVTAMDAGAWSGGTADGFYDELTGHRTAARNGADNAIQEFEDAISGMPEMVDSDSWYVRWHRLL